MASTGKKQPESRGSNQSEFVHRFKTNPLLFVGTLVVLVIVIVAFVLVPAIVPEARGTMTELSFGSYNKTPIEYVPGNYFAQVQENYARYRQSSTDDVNFVQVSMEVWRQAFEDTVIHTAILEEMGNAGYTPSQERVDEEVARQYQVNGVFDAARYRQLDKTTRMAQWRLIRDSLTQQRYQEDITGLRVPTKETEFITAMASSQRSFDMVAFPLSSYPDEEISAYVRANPALFRLTHLSRITVSSSESEAQNVLKSVQDGTSTFEEAASTHSQDAYNDRGGDMGLKMVYELTTEIPDTEARDTVTALQAGQYSPIVKVPAGGWAFFRAEVSPYPVDMTDSANLTKIRGYLTDFERGRIEDWIIDQAENFIARVRADGGHHQLKEDLQFPRAVHNRRFNYGGVDILRHKGAQYNHFAESNESFWRTAFFTPLETPSTPLVVGNSVLVFYPLTETQAEDTSLDTIKSIYSYWLSYNAETSLRYYFLRSEKLQDHFFESFYKLIYNPAAN